MQRRSVVLDVVGEGPDQPSLIALATELGVSERILWRGHVPHTEIPALLARACVLVAPFVDEGLGLVAVEAQLCETPPVGFASGGLTDVIQDDVTGLLVPPGDEQALANALERVVGDPELRQRLGRTGREASLSRFAPQNVAAVYVRVYQQAMLAQPSVSRRSAGAPQ